MRFVSDDESGLPAVEALGDYRYVLDTSRWRTSAGVVAMSGYGPAGMIGWNIDPDEYPPPENSPGFNPGPGVVGYGNSRGGTGILGIGTAQAPREHGASVAGLGSGAGVAGYNDNPKGGPGVLGVGAAAGGEGIKGLSETGSPGVGGYNQTTAASGGPGVLGVGAAAGGEGIKGLSETGSPGVGGYNQTTAASGGPGVLGMGAPNGGEGVRGEGYAAAAGVAGFAHGTGPAIAGFAASGPAALFVGDVSVHGSAGLYGPIKLAGHTVCLILPTAAAQPLGVGTVVVLDANGNAQPCTTEYDPTVVGVTPGAHTGFYPINDPAIILGHGSPDQPGTSQGLVATLGILWCKADATAAAIRPGDMLTTSTSAGYCQRLTDPTRALGAVVGKALTPLASGQGLVNVIVNPR